MEGEGPRPGVPKPINVLLIEEDDDDAALIIAEVEGAGITANFLRATTKRQVLAAFRRPRTVDAVLCAYRGRGVRVWQALDIMRNSGSLAPLLVISRGLSDEQAAECMRLGAVEYILKERLGRLPHALLQAIAHAQERRASGEMERGFRRLFESIPMAIFQVTMEGEIRHANQAAVHMLGFPDLATMLARPVRDLYVNPQEWETLLARLEETGHVLDYESQMRRADGSTFWFLRSVHAVKDEAGEVGVWETIGRDNTERRQAAHALSEAATYLSTVIETAPDAVVRMDETGVINDWNAAAEEIFGWTRDEVLGRRVSETMFPPDLREANMHGMARFHRDGSSTLVGRRWDSFEGLRRNAEVFPIELAVSPAIPLGERTQYVGFVRDVSERKQAEADLAHSEERMRSLLTGAPVAVVMTDREGRVTFAAGSVFGELGFDPATLVGADVPAAFPGRGDLLELLSDSLERDVHRDVEFAGRSFHVRAGPFRLSPESEILGVRAVSFDNSDRVHAEQRLSRRVEQQELLLELARSGLEGREPAQFLELALEVVKRATRTQFATIVEMRSGGAAPTRIAASGMPVDMPVSEAVAARAHTIIAAMGSDAPVTTIYWDQEPTVDRGAWMTATGVRASMATAVGELGSPFGIIAVHSTRSAAFDDGDLQFMLIAGTIISVAIERQRAESQRRMLLGRIVTAQEAERKSIAADIHDDAVQVLTAANMRLALFQMALTDPEHAAAAQRLQETIGLATGRLRTLLFELVPPDLDRYGLESALRRHLEPFGLEAAVKWELSSDLTQEPTPANRILLFRIFQEALVNVRKHAHAANVMVSLTNANDGVLMVLQDDGGGFDETTTARAAGHLGVASMRERAEIAGGWLTISSQVEKGTVLSAWVPAAPRVTASEETVASDLPGLEVTAVVDG